MGPAGPKTWLPCPSTMIRTSTPRFIFCTRRSASFVPISPSRHPNMTMWTDEWACSISAKIFGKKFLPSGQGSIVAAVDQAYGIPTSAGFGSVRAAKRSVASWAPAAVIALAVGGQLGFCVICSTCR